MYLWPVTDQNGSDKMKSTIGWDGLAGYILESLCKNYGGLCGLGKDGGGGGLSVNVSVQEQRSEKRVLHRKWIWVWQCILRHIRWFWVLVLESPVRSGFCCPRALTITGLPLSQKSKRLDQTTKRLKTAVKTG